MISNDSPNGGRFSGFSESTITSSSSAADTGPSSKISRSILSRRLLGGDPGIIGTWNGGANMPGCTGNMIYQIEIQVDQAFKDGAIELLSSAGMVVDVNCRYNRKYIT